MSSDTIFMGFVLLFLVSIRAQAYEVDNFTHREILTRDSLPVLNEKVNRIFEKATKEHNKISPRFCSEALLRQEILRWIRPDPVGQLEVWAATTDEIQQVRVPFKESIYQNVTILDSPMLWMVGIGRSFLLGGHVIGTDKLGHFFVQGLTYYDDVKEGVELKKVLTEEHHEDGIWGLKTSGVFSYADMAANYQGYVFWRDAFEGEHPLFRCDTGKAWVQTRKFDWSKYVNDAWDEAINCSEMRASVAEKTLPVLKKESLQCPVSPEKCKEILALDHAEYFISPRCRIAAASATHSLASH